MGAETPQGHRDAGQVRADAERELNEQLDEKRKGDAGGRQERELETEQERRQREERERVAGQPV